LNQICPANEHIGYADLPTTTSVKFVALDKRRKVHLVVCSVNNLHVWFRVPPLFLQ